MWTSSEERTCCVREPVGECHPLAMIAYGENGPRWHNERRQAKVNVRPPSSPVSAVRTLQLLVGNNSSDLMAGSCLQIVQQFCSAHVARCFPSCVATSLCDSSDDFSTLAQENKSPSVYHLFIFKRSGWPRYLGLVLSFTSPSICSLCAARSCSSAN